MNHRQRAGAILAALVPAIWASYPARAQTAPKSQAKPSGIPSAQKPPPKPASANAAVPTILATVNGEPITRDQVLDQLLADQTSRLSATLPEAMDRQRLVAGSIGALVLTRMKSNGGSPVTISRAEMKDWLVKDKLLVSSPFMRQTVENAIREKAIAQAARKQGIVVAPGDITAKISELANNARTQLRLTTMTDAQIINAIGIRPAFLREQLITQLQVEAMLKRDLEKKWGRPVDKGDFADVSHILVRAQADPANPMNTDKAFADALTKIKGFAEEIKSGKRTFEAVALAESDDPGSKMKMGGLGVIMRGQTVPEFDKAVFTLEPGKVSDPIRTTYGWHLIRVNRQGKDTTGPERAQAQQAYMRDGIQKLVGDIMQTTKIVRNMPQTDQPMMMGQ